MSGSARKTRFVRARGNRTAVPGSTRQHSRGAGDWREQQARSLVALICAGSGPWACIHSDRRHLIPADQLAADWLLRRSTSFRPAKPEDKRAQRAGQPFRPRVRPHGVSNIIVSVRALIGRLAVR